jgi:hypothetical protein
MGGPILSQAHNRNEGSMQITIRQFGNISEALLAKGCLDAAGIENVLTDVNMSWLEWPVSRGMRLMVNAEDARDAIEVIGVDLHSSAAELPPS